MFFFLFRVVGMIVLALALVLAVLDITRSITAAAVVMTPLANVWSSVSPNTLVSTKLFVEQNLLPVIWDPMMVFFLKLPSWLVCWAFAMFFLWLGQKRENPYGRFASH